MNKVYVNDLNIHQLSWNYEGATSYRFRVGSNSIAKDLFYGTGCFGLFFLIWGINWTRFDWVSGPLLEGGGSKALTYEFLSLESFWLVLIPFLGKIISWDMNFLLSKGTLKDGLSNSICLLNTCRIVKLVDVSPFIESRTLCQDRIIAHGWDSIIKHAWSVC